MLTQQDLATIMMNVTRMLQDPGFNVSILIATFNPEAWQDFIVHTQIIARNIDSREVYNYFQGNYYQNAPIATATSNPTMLFRELSRHVIASALNIAYTSPDTPSAIKHH